MTELDKLRDDWRVKYYWHNELADALIAALEAENEKLRCCGNCRQHVWVTKECRIMRETPLHPTDVRAHDPCHFTPSRWTRREK